MGLWHRIAPLGLCLVWASGCGGGSTGGNASSGSAAVSGNASGSTSSGSTSSGSMSDGGPSSGSATSGTLTGGSLDASVSFSGDAGADGAASAHCTNPAHTLALDPANPQNGITLSGFYVDADTWNVTNYQVSQTMYICDYNDWYVVANMNNDSGDGAVKTYPDVHEDFSSAPAISTFTTITSTFAHTAPHVGIYEFAYDIWLNGVATNGSTEVMIWTDNYNQVPSGSKTETVTLDGESYDVFKSGSYIAFVETTSVTSGSVNLLSFFNHIISKGWVPSTSTLGAIDYGVELVSTGGRDATFALDGFSLTTN